MALVKSIKITHGIFSLDLDWKTDLQTKKHISMKRGIKSLHYTRGNHPSLEVEHRSVVFFFLIDIFTLISGNQHIRVELSAI